ncbi:RNA methyltransferase, TrmH family [Reichenbachiella faecimaris]|uniref:RNA methyltransferase, TrmH family n=1 Tax=Reichenbachiella faecimaris TaxID=692418 RepID=A0A1W2GN75_REIFA|nr:RNA methyltransferase [Reichenbachiella faecimaris]SMD38119.1 RNA methyltransferase, TrmH family [Reichenbachiella faecimaris]
MISNRESKFIKSLQLKKFRQLENQFVVEGAKNVLELLKSGLEVIKVFATTDFMAKHKELLSNHHELISETKEADLKKAGSFSANNAALALVKIPDETKIDTSQSILAFDRIKDPGNLGTVIRIADWYGFKQIVCSSESVDCYNPKVISATMGSFARVRVHYTDLAELLDQSEHVYGTTLQGDNIHKLKFQEPAVVVFGNESEGLSEDLKPYLTQEVFIPGYGSAESLNVAVSTAVFCDNFRRLLKA